ncbi:diaminohydroxyphosphoribosylaminopyrimidine deaminase [Rhizobiales bacterium GAS113]|nr:diaminohydroxyphosphoribosylaminopyrimidine deaminase [Rhizobiales bacterium GAS113]SEE56629.1 diaminohydroxyphosphoribosylaminopyrimidine deaminase [Rhizobiales bacterium GAS188]
MKAAAGASTPSPDGRWRPADRAFMRQAIALGERHLGLTAPNPSVGAILVDETQGSPEILARTVTAPGGRPHAERQAIETAGGRARGATLFVTLEPCAHHGSTPPCAEAVIAAGIARVVGGIEDPDPRVAGKGFAMLRASGIEVLPGLMAPECLELNAGHILRVTQQRPLVTLKLAMTADGFAAMSGPRPVSITGSVANAQTHLLRARSDAILVGVGTVLADDPQLDCRLPGLAERSPIRVVLDTHLRTPVTAKLVATSRIRPSWIIAGADAPREAEARLAGAGVEVVRVALDEAGRVGIRPALQALAARGITRLLCEGGPGLADALAGENVLDEVITIASPKRLEEQGLAAIGPSLSRLLAQGLMVQTETLAFGEDRWARYVRVCACSPES